MSPSDNKKKPLRQLAAEKIHGKGANPTQLGDPISLKAETSDHDVPYDGNTDDQGFPKTVRSPPPSSGGSHEEKKLGGGHHVRGMMTEDIKQGKVGPPSKGTGGDPTSMKAATTKYSADHGNGPSGKGVGSSAKL